MGLIMYWVCILSSILFSLTSNFVDGHYTVHVQIGALIFSFMLMIISYLFLYGFSHYYHIYKIKKLINGGATIKEILELEFKE